MAINIAENVTSDGSTSFTQVISGRYMVAAAGVFDGATVTVNVNIGVAKNVPIDGMVYTTAKAEIVWLANCTVNITVASAGANTPVAAHHYSLNSLKVKLPAHNGQSVSSSLT